MLRVVLRAHPLRVHEKCGSTSADQTAAGGMMRLMVCGSAALPAPTFESWQVKLAGLSYYRSRAGNNSD